MNRERTRELLPVMQAYADGSDVQYKADEATGWQDLGQEDPEWCVESEYRIKPPSKYRREVSDCCGAMPSNGMCGAACSSCNKHCALVTLDVADESKSIYDKIKELRDLGCDFVVNWPKEPGEKS